MNAWENEIPQIKVLIEYYEDFLFGDLEPFAAAILITSSTSRQNKATFKTKLSFKKIKWDFKERSSIKQEGEEEKSESSGDESPIQVD